MHYEYMNKPQFVENIKGALVMSLVLQVTLETVHSEVLKIAITGDITPKLSVLPYCLLCWECHHCHWLACCWALACNNSSPIRCDSAPQYPLHLHYCNSTWWVNVMLGLNFCKKTGRKIVWLETCEAPRFPRISLDRSGPDWTERKPDQGKFFTIFLGQCGSG